MSTPAIFKARYPEFISVNDALVSLVLEESACDIGDCWLEKDRVRGQLLLAAHTLSCEGYPSRDSDGCGSCDDAGALGLNSLSSSTGNIIELKDRDASIRFSDSQSDINSTIGDGTLGEIQRGYLKTPYGQQFLRLLKRNVAGVAVV